MKKPSWLKKTKNDAEERSSRHRRPPSLPPAELLLQLPTAPRPEDYLTQTTCIVVPPRRQHNRRYVPLKECKQRWHDNEGIDHPDVSLPHTVGT
jgi:hypothetical protein